MRNGCGNSRIDMFAEDGVYGIGEDGVPPSPIMASSA
jgi:hypothetical protein